MGFRAGFFLAESGMTGETKMASYFLEKGVSIRCVQEWYGRRVDGRG